MSSKSDLDNRSNQLNSNNHAYHDSRSGGRDRDDYDDYDGDVGGHRAKSPRRIQRAPSVNEVILRNHFFAAVAFDGSTLHVRFQTKSERMMGAYSSDWTYIESSVHSRLLAEMRAQCPLGVAYCRSAIDGNRGGFHWHTPETKEKYIGAVVPDEPIHRIRDRAWYASARKIANEFEERFDWNRHEGASDFGLIISEVSPRKES